MKDPYSSICMCSCTCAHTFPFESRKQNPSFPGNKNTPFPAILLCVCYDLRPGILIKPQKGKDGWGSREFTCPLWLSCYAVAPDLHSRFPSLHPIGIIKLRTTGVGAGVWAHSGNWRIEQRGWGVGGSCCCRCFPSYHRGRSVYLTSHPGRPGLLPQRELGNFQLEGTVDWAGLIPDLREIGWSEPPQDWGWRQTFTNRTGGSLL